MLIDLESVNFGIDVVVVPGPPGPPGGPGVPGPAPWGAITAWATGQGYTSTPPASVVTYGGETFVCHTAHTSGGLFDATKFTKIAQKGDAVTPGGSDGNVQFKSGLNFAGSAGLFWENASGRLGIGTTSSSAPLHVFNSVSTVARFQRDGGSIATQGYLDVIISDFDGGGGDVILDSAAGDIALRSNAGSGGTVRVKNGGDTVITGGNVGIGTTTPSTALHVNGPARVGQYTVATLPSASTAGFGAIVFVSDANAVTPRSIVAGGGANKAMVWSDGANWLVAV